MYMLPCHVAQKVLVYHSLYSLLSYILMSRYLNVYKKYSNLLDNKANQDITAFLNKKHSLEGFSKVRRCGSPSKMPTP